MIGAITAGLLAGGVAASTTSYESIATISPAGTSTLTFNSIPSTYKHLQVRIIAAASDGLQGGYMQFNGTTSPYYTHYVGGNGATASAGGLSNSFIYSYFYGSGSSMGVSVIDIFDYTSTNKNKTTRSLVGYDNNGSGTVQLYSGFWYPTTPVAITSITFTTTGTNYQTGTQFALYGIKG